MLIEWTNIDFSINIKMNEIKIAKYNIDRFFK